MTEIEIKQLLAEERFSDGLHKLYLLLYLPIGCIIAILRIILGTVVITLGNILPDVTLTRNILTKLFRAVFGIIIYIDKLENKENVKVLISNCVSPLDHLVAHVATGCLLPRQLNLPDQLMHSLGLRNFGIVNSLEDLKKLISSYILNNSTPLIFQPENKITNGKAIIQFTEYPFSFTDEVQPVCLKVRRPMFNIAITTISSSYWSDIFWFLFSPCTIYNLTFLAVVKKENENLPEFVEKVRQSIANGLEVGICAFEVSDILEWEKRYIAEQRRVRLAHSTTSTRSFSNNPELHRMARQVKEVLPTVPFNVILKDLARTKNIDVTIANILEGHVPYTPESETSVSPGSSRGPSFENLPVAGTSLQDSCKKDTLSTGAASFPKSAQERMQSFQERKLQLIMAARKRYMDKHGLNALASNNC